MDGCGPVGERLKFDGYRQAASKLRKKFSNFFDHCDRVGARLFAYIHDHRGRVIHPRGQLGILDSVRDLRDVRQHDGRAILIGHHDVAVAGA